MNLVDNFKNGIKEYIKHSEMTGWEEGEFVKEIGVKGIKCAFLSDVIFGLTTYDTGLDIEFGKDILEVMEVINNKTNFEYIKYEGDDYKKFILVANLLDQYNWIEWGSSIRGCWFSPYYNPTIYEDLDNFNMSKIEFDDEGEDISNLLKYLRSEEL